ncbi:hypothetical protein [Arenimonas composti]|uniref:Uncharacterized protein n=1 Tax=Arenimonas composti TR7-09 = DSM 18010 TaxID=1121013 RepID=A0A091BGD6_9GAMM|nr:hypothetical protein [Arenimonas composti]KFN50587.1 hypothetical protein P873_05350 [Arenimonas composti TR7-09 = DSM 18010]
MSLVPGMPRRPEERSAKRAFLVGSVLLLIVVPGVFLVIRDAALETDFCPACRTMVVLCCKPKDYYAPIFERRMDLQAGEEVVVSATPIYPGLHGVVLNIEAGPVPETSGLVCAIDGRELAPVSTDTRIFDSLGEGVNLATFDIERAHLGKPLICRFTADSSATGGVLRMAKKSDL